MRTFAIIAATAALTSTITSAAKADLKVGDPAPPLSVSKWVKGTPNKLTPGKVHVVEFWATWCGPCKATIPHLTELSKKYKAKADFSGISIWEGNGGDTNPVAIEKKVNAFVKQMGAKMDYSIAMDDKITGGTMATKWMAAASQKGIPTVFIVDQAGTVAWLGHPMDMDIPLERICAGNFDAAAYAKEASSRKNADNEKLQAFMMKLETLLVGGKIDDAMSLVDAETSGNTTEAKAMRTKVSMLLYAFAFITTNPKQTLPPNFEAMKKSNVQLARKALALSDGEDSHLYDTLALTLAMAGNYKEAAEIQEKTVAKLSVGVPAEMRKEYQARLADYRTKSN
jgi:thiol-disulfide isomerase/thioredoxin